MIEPTKDEIRNALASIANGSTTECSDPNGTGIFKYLHTKGYITGQTFGLNRFQLENLALTSTGKQLLRS